MTSYVRSLRILLLVALVVTVVYVLVGTISFLPFGLILLLIEIGALL